MSERFATPLQLTNTSRVLHRGPALLYSVFVDGDGVAAQVDIYDGLNTTGTHLMRINTGADAGRGMSFRRPVSVERGVYVAVNAATTYVSLQIEPLSRAHPDV